MHLQNSAGTQGSGIITKKGGGSLTAKEQEVCYKIVSPRNIQTYNHEESLLWLPKHDLYNGDTNGHVSVDEGKLMRPQP